ncbi:nitrate reductase molybdenum cofactor assembly chaperone, partial [Streptomyces sp. NPDC001348]
MSPLPPTIPALVRTRVRAAVRRPARLGPEETAGRALMLRLVSLLLQYPDPELTGARGDLTTVVEALPATPGAEHL